MYISIYATYLYSAYITSTCYNILLKFLFVYFLSIKSIRKRKGTKHIFINFCIYLISFLILFICSCGFKIPFSIYH